MEWIGVLFFFAVLGYAMLAMLALPKMKTGHALLSAVCGMLFVAYYGVIILGLMVPTACVLMYGGLAAFAAGAVCTALNVRTLRKRLLSPGMMVFALLCAYILYGAQGIVIQVHDDLSYWARVVKELYTFDRFYIHADATMFHMDYIPLLAALQYSVVRVFGWQDAYLSFVTAVSIAASLAAMAEVFRKRWAACVMAVLFVYALRLYSFPLWNLRSDGSMLTVFTAGLLCAISREDDSWTSLMPSILCCAVLPGFKIYSGLMYAAVIVIVMAVDCLTAVRKKRAWRKLAACACTALLLVLALQMSWSVKYNYHMAVAAAENAAAHAVRMGLETAAGDTSISVGELLSGNPRTAALMQSFTPEKIETFLRLAWQTVKMYVSSKLIWTWLFLIPVAALCFISSREKRALAIQTVLYLVLAALIYVLGLFGSYFVQAETSGAAIVYLSTASAPLLLGALYLTAVLGQDNARAASAVMLALMTGGIALLCPFTKLIPKTEKEDYKDEAALAVDFYEYDLDGLLKEEDAGKCAVLIENSYQATEVSSQSGKTHAYAYYGLPLRVMEPVYLEYGNYAQLENFNGEWLKRYVIESRCELLIVRVEDFMYWDAICEALELYGEYDDCIGVYDVIYEDGELSFEFRLMEEY